MSEQGTLPVDFHCHGLGRFDFSALELNELDQINDLARSEMSLCLMTVYLPYARLERFVEFMAVFGARKRHGELSNLVGVSIEGPLLASFGGTPERGVWMPTRAEWELLAQQGAQGLRYVVLSPDFDLADDLNTPGAGEKVDRATAIGTLLDYGVSPALGHFRRIDPIASAAAVDECVGLRSGSATGIVTDHLFNDMPLRFRHASRLPDFERPTRPWSLEALDEEVGVVGAAMMRHASTGALTACLNFDGEHVDLEYCRMALDIVGCDNVILMTDRTDSPWLGGQRLSQPVGSTLWFQERGVVAAGSQSLAKQRQNVLSLGYDETVVHRLTVTNPHRVLCGTRGP